MTIEGGRYVVLFSRVEGAPHWSAPHWRAELYDSADQGWLSHPLGIAYLTEYPPHAEIGTVLDYLIVFDHHRGQGHAGRLVRACKALWPSLHLTRRLRPDGTWRDE